MSPIFRPCLKPRCPVLVVPPAVYCTEHGEEESEARSEWREQNEPWRKLYTTTQWEEARSLRMRRDGFKCARCGSKRHIAVHHLTKLRDLWKSSPDWGTFVREATRLDKLLTLCGSCHKTEDNRLA